MHVNLGQLHTKRYISINSNIDCQAFDLLTVFHKTQKASNYSAPQLKKKLTDSLYGTYGKQRILNNSTPESIDATNINQHFATCS
jgi:hypothetical protein